MIPSNFKIGIAGQKDKYINYENACKAQGLHAVTTLSLSELSTCDALILPGGGDVTPGYYGKENCGSHSIDTELDLIQFAVLDAFIRTKKPVLGICRGHQLINVYFGGTLIQHLPNSDMHRQEEGDNMHECYTIGDSILRTLYGERFVVNSSHHQAVETLGKGLHIIQKSQDDVIEGIIHESLPIMAVQWHPERLPIIQTKKAALSGSLLLRAFFTNPLV